MLDTEAQSAAKPQADPKSATSGVAAAAKTRRRRQGSEALNLGLALLALPAAFLLRFETWPTGDYRRLLLEALPWVLAAKICAFRFFSVRDLAWRYLGFEDLLRIVAANLGASVLTVAAVLATVGSAFPRSIYILDWLLSIAWLALARAIARLWLDRRRSSAGRAMPGGVRRTLIYGAGQAGRLVVSEIRAHPEMGIEAVGFIDDDPAKKHLRASGLRVWGGGDELASIVRRLGVDQIWLAMPNASGAEIARMLELCQAARVPAQRIPPLAEWVEHKGLVDQVREVRIEDLLGRPPVRLEPGNAWIEGKVVLVTGAGGSIGSELCRQIARARPRSLIGLDHSENALYQIDQELREHFAAVDFQPEIATIQNPRRLQEIFSRHRPEVVYHAAAYKHVPLMEEQIFEAIENNVFGTARLKEAALASGTDIFVLISSDKAVRPANVMGATKRLAEMVCLENSGHDNVTLNSIRFEHAALEKALFHPDLVERPPRGPLPCDDLAGRGQPVRPQTGRGSTCFMAVRFGNVLGSSGSVIPLFRRQIAAGGPLTVTHPNMQRYFMTIPEAVQLVLRTAEFGTSGEIFVLDMGDPVKIVDLARKMVLLSGLHPDRDIQIEYCGLRPGEKLYEELHLAEEDTQATPHAKIRVYRSSGGASGTGLGREGTAHVRADSGSLQAKMKELERHVAARDMAATVLILKELVPDYSPSTALLRRALARPYEVRGKAAGA